MKKLPLITLLSFSILIPTITLAKSKNGYEYNLVEKKGINNYYFFDEPSTKSNFDERYQKNETTTTNYTLFKDFENEWIKTNSQEIMLSNNCEQEYPGQECWSYAKFYYIFNEIEKKGRTIKASNYITPDDISQKESNIEKNDIYNKELRDDWEKTTIIYHGHSGYKKDISGEWYNSTKNDNAEATAILKEKDIPTDFNILSSDSKKYVSLICSAIKTENDVKLVGYDDKPIKDDKIGERPTIVRIIRKYKTYNAENNKYDGIEIDWNNLKTNMPNGSSTNYCDGKIYKTKQLTNDTNGVVHSAVLYKMQEISTEKQCVEIKKTSSAKCNESAKMENVKCLKTITKGKNRRDVKLDQTATLTNILTPTKIYQGGGIKLGFMYYNTVKWNFSKDEKYGDDDSGIRALLASKLKSTEEIENDITVEVYLKDENGKKYNIDNIQKKCTRDDDNSEFEEDKTVTTTCTFLLPKSIVDLGTGKVTYKNDPGQGINNEYYTPITYNGELSLYAKISKIGVLKEKDVDGWTDNWTLTYDGENDDSCKVNVTSRLYKPDQSNKYAFIYRPIDLNNPFPNRNAGVNWYSWYSIPANKERLKSSYSKKEYQVELDNQSVSKIKEYNKNNNYLNWTGINEETGKSKFIDEYNIVRIQEGGNP